MRCARLGAAAITGTVTWRAVSVLDADAERTGLLGQAQVHSELDAQRASGTTDAPMSGAYVLPTPVPATLLAEVTRTWIYSGGTVAVTCTDTAIALSYATPADGWTVEGHSTAPDVVEVELAREPREIVVRARCTDTEPVADVSEHSDSED